MIFKIIWKSFQALFGDALFAMVILLAIIMLGLWWFTDALRCIFGV